MSVLSPPYPPGNLPCTPTNSTLSGLIPCLRTLPTCRVTSPRGCSGSCNWHQGRVIGAWSAVLYRLGAGRAGPIPVSYTALSTDHMGIVPWRVLLVLPIPPRTAALVECVLRAKSRISLRFHPGGHGIPCPLPVPLHGTRHDPCQRKRKPMELQRKGNALISLRFSGFLNEISRLAIDWHGS